MPARHENIDFVNFPLYDAFLESLDLVEQNGKNLSKSDHFWPIYGR